MFLNGYYVIRTLVPNKSFGTKYLINRTARYFFWRPKDATN